MKFDIEERPWRLPRSFFEFIFIFSSCIFVYLLVFQFPFTPFLKEGDHHIFLYEAMRMLDGDKIYLDFFQFTFPGSQIYYLFLFKIFGLKYWILGATIVLIAAFSSWGGLLVSKQAITDKFYYLPAFIFIFFGFRWIGLDGSHRTFSPIFIMLAIWVLLRRQHLFDYLLSGLFCALASFFTQQRGFLTLLAIVLFVFIDGVMLRKRFSEILRPVVVICVSFIVILGTLIAYFIFTAGFDIFFYSTLVYPAKYYRFSIHNNFSALPFELGYTLQISTLSQAFAALPVLFYLFILPFGYIVFWILFLIRRRRHPWEFWRNIFLISLVGSLLTFTITAPNSNRLFEIAMPGLVIFVWLLVYFKDHFNTFFAKPVPGILTAASIFLILLGISQAYRMQSWDYEIMNTPTGRLAYLPTEIIDQRYNWLLERTQPGDYVYEVYDPYIYFPLGLKNPTRYGQIWDTAYTRPEQVAEVVEQLKLNPPHYILWNNLYNKSVESRISGDNIAPLYDYLLEYYKPAGKVIHALDGQIQIWERKN